MAKYAWYTRVADTVHRLTVLTLVGGCFYIVGGLSWTIYQNGKKFEQQQQLAAKPAEEDQQQPQQ
ncbi:Cox14p CYBJADRAFT_153471 [Cyberlindnera jadinii NRRL Y-1542]|uniref:COX14 protein n=1 Tax=Cyberlindnera jadinii (strain ATCC 18201 / CBS 1600 / BCRC 20928 / JCM 3617 / NBRC 0987 / NRRL Y-1542) TaxID=983966 RepID=A0A1E4RZ06_CYBJN|nr:hypothetical protein CYBJADRAFT_153471 [Cyberlindnera jadinii NRRL Y-1542]ODV72451.1 hypothetical protein CYBJADRAFT_153471 [Cyberlindnera jadinii NRRL Y-1542]